MKKYIAFALIGSSLLLAGCTKTGGLAGTPTPTPAPEMAVESSGDIDTDLEAVDKVLGSMDDKEDLPTVSQQELTQ